jgi:hypothetical protein
MKPRFRVKARSRPVPTVVAFRAPESAPEVFEILDQFMTLAKDGRLDGLAVAGTSRDGNAHTAYYMGTDLFRLSGVTQHVLRRLTSNAVMQQGEQ